MKVTLTNESKQYLRMSEAPIARKIIEELKEDESTAADYASYAVNAAYSGFGGVCEKVFEATAKIAKNCRVNDCYLEGSGDLDIWIDATAKTTDGFCVIGAYLSDIWGLCGENDAQVARDYMYVHKFVPVQ